MDPTSLTQKGLTGTYGQQYRVAADQNANQQQQAVKTTLQDLNNRGMGATPAGFAADQERKAYADQASTNATNYAAASGQQNTDALTNYWNANNMLNTYGTTQGAQAISNNQGAAGTNTSLYGTASQQKPGLLGSLVSGAASVGGAAVTKYCWIAEALYGEDSAKTRVLRHYLSTIFRRTIRGKMIMALYGVFGKKMAKIVQTNALIAAAVRPFFEMAFSRALEVANG